MTTCEREMQLVFPKCLDSAAIRIVILYIYIVFPLLLIYSPHKKII